MLSKLAQQLFVSQNIMPNRAAKFSTDYLSKEQMSEALAALPTVLQSLLGDHVVMASYGVAAKLHGDLCWKPMKDHTLSLQYLIEDSIQQGIIVPGEADFYFDVPEDRLRVLFCHEADIHVDGSDDALIQKFISSKAYADYHWYSQEEVARMF
jgi:hypothetical protein